MARLTKPPRLQLSRRKGLDLQAHSRVDIPTIMSAPMVRATLREVEAPGTGKTMTRRLAWRDARLVQERDRAKLERQSQRFERRDDGNCYSSAPSPWQRVKPGDRLWVRESLLRSPEGHWRYAADGVVILMQKTDPRVGAMIAWAHHKEGNSAPAIHLPRWASRLTLIVTVTKIERLQDIREAEAMAEGVNQGPSPVFADSTYRWGFQYIWGKLHGPDAWDANPEVVAITFKPYKANIDSDVLLELANGEGRS